MFALGVPLRPQWPRGLYGLRRVLREVAEGILCRGCRALACYRSPSSATQRRQPVVVLSLEASPRFVVTDDRKCVLAIKAERLAGSRSVPDREPAGRVRPHLWEWAAEWPLGDSPGCRARVRTEGRWRTSFSSGGRDGRSSYCCSWSKARRSSGTRAASTIASSSGRRLDGNLRDRRRTRAEGADGG